MHIVINGSPDSVSDDATVASLVAERKLNPDVVAVELNRKILRRTEWNTALTEGDAVEILSFVGGG